jgi:SM-20-related protein
MPHDITQAQADGSAADLAAATGGHADAAIAAIVEAIAAEGLAITADAFPPRLVRALRESAHRRDAAGEFGRAGIGRAAARTEGANVRGDRMRWLDTSEADQDEAVLFAWLERLRRQANLALQLGLFDFEGHYAIYPTGAGYTRHLDRFRDDDARVLTLIAYLNDAWTDADGGQLRIELGNGVTRDVLPRGGTVVAFACERFPHEVLPALRERFAFTGWFRRRP